MKESPNRPLRGQTALITGASSGIGAGTARAFAAQGIAVGINYFGSPEAAEAMAKEISGAGGTAEIFAADVSQEADVQKMFAGFVERFGRLDILVANAGIQRDAAFADMKLEDWRRVLDVNLGGQFLCAREAVRQFKRQGHDPRISRAAGKIICISSVHQVIPWAGHVNYATSKGGIMLMMKSLAQEVAQDRIRVNGIAPGAIKTRINQTAWETPEAEAKLLTLIPYGRVGETEDVAAAAVWLASDEADYVTGTTLFVDGGMTLYPAFFDNG